MRFKSEKRKQPRVIGNGIWARMKVDGALDEAVIENVSFGGALVHTPHACKLGKAVALDLRGTQSDLRLMGRIVGVQPTSRRGYTAVRISFNPISKRTADELSTMLHGLPSAREETHSSCATDPEAFEQAELKAGLADTFEKLKHVADEPTYTAA